MATPATKPRFTEVISDHSLGQIFRASDPQGMYLVKELKIAPAIDENHVKEIHDRFGADASRLAALPATQRLAQIKSHYVDSASPMVVFHEPSGPKLADYLKRNRTANEDAILGLAADIVGIYGTLKKAGVLRLNSDPDCWHLGKDGRAMYLDLHFADYDLCERALPERLWAGNIKFLAPEQLEGLGSVPSTQVFSLGVLFYFLFTGRTPFEGPSRQAVRNLIQRTEAKSILLERVSLPGGLAEAIDLALCRYPDGRPQSLEEFAHAAGLPDPENAEIAAIAPAQAESAPEVDISDSNKDEGNPDAPPPWLPKVGIACAVAGIVILTIILFKVL